MRSITLSLFLFLSLQLFSQQQYDILSYQLPVGWSTVPGKGQLVLQKNNCRIIILSSIKGKIQTNAEFRNIWTKPAASYGGLAETINPEVQQVEEWTMYTCGGNTKPGQPAYQFTSITNGSVILNMILIIEKGECYKDAEYFLSSIELTPANTKPSGTKNKAKEKKVVKFKPGKALKEEVGG